jgi:hypothetical protein
MDNYKLSVVANLPDYINIIVCDSETIFKTEISHKADIRGISISFRGNPDDKAEALFCVGGQIIFRQPLGSQTLNRLDFTQLMASEYFPATLLEFHLIELYVISTTQTTNQAEVYLIQPQTYPYNIETKGWIIDCYTNTLAPTLLKGIRWGNIVAYKNKLVNNPFNNSITIADGMCGLQFALDQNSIW